MNTFLSFLYNISLPSSTIANWLVFVWEKNDKRFLPTPSMGWNERDPAVKKERKEKHHKVHTWMLMDFWGGNQNAFSLIRSVKRKQTDPAFSSPRWRSRAGKKLLQADARCLCKRFSILRIPGTWPEIPQSNIFHIWFQLGNEKGKARHQLQQASPWKLFFFTQGNLC